METRTTRDAYTLFSFSIKGDATLEQFTRFLYDFYSAGHLHKISKLTITPIENSRLLQLLITVEALSLPGSTQKDKLAAASSKRLKLASWDDYKKVIVGRNLFAPYTPQSTADSDKARRDAQNSDPARATYLTAIIESNGAAEAWLYVQPTNETFKLHEGEEFSVGSVLGKVSRIGRGEIEIEINGQRRTLSYGDTLAM